MLRPLEYQRMASSAIFGDCKKPVSSVVLALTKAAIGKLLRKSSLGSTFPFVSFAPQWVLRNGLVKGRRQAIGYL